MLSFTMHKAQVYFHKPSNIVNCRSKAYFVILVCVIGLSTSSRQGSGCSKQGGEGFFVKKLPFPLLRAKWQARPAHRGQAY